MPDKVTKERQTFDLYNINKVCVSRIQKKKFKRIGVHPLKDVLFKRAHPFRYWLFGGFVRNFDFVQKAHIKVQGADGSHLLSIMCVSNSLANTLFEDLRIDLGFKDDE